MAWVVPQCLVRRDDAGALLRFPFNQDYIDDLKTILPRHARRWVPQEKAWRIFEPWVEGALELAEAYFEVAPVEQLQEVEWYSRDEIF